METSEYIDLIDQQRKEQDDFYHRLAVKFGLSDTALWALYMIAYTDAPVTQQDLCRACFFPKQTVNCAINGLVRDGYLTLEPFPETKKSKRLCFTEKGREFAKKSTALLREAEIRAYEKFTAAELKEFLEANRRLTSCLREEFEKIYPIAGKESKKR